MMAAKVGSTEMVRILLKHGADVNSKDENGEFTIFFIFYTRLFIYICIYQKLSICSLNNEILNQQIITSR